MEFSRQEYWSGLPFPSPRGQESKLSFRHSESGALKGKETTRNVQACAVFRLSCLLSGKEREKLLPLFLLLTATLSAHSHLTFSSPSASNSKQRELSAKEAQEARRGRGGVPCHPQRRVQDDRQNRPPLLGRLQRAPLSEAAEISSAFPVLWWAHRSRPLPDLGAGPQQAGPPGPACDHESCVC